MISYWSVCGSQSTVSVIGGSLRRRLIQRDEGFPRRGVVNTARAPKRPCVINRLDTFCCVQRHTPGLLSGVFFFDWRASAHELPQIKADGNGSCDAYRTGYVYDCLCTCSASPSVATMTWRWYS